MIDTSILIIGAGPAGLATAASLTREGLPATILERSHQIAASWHNHYDRLHLHTDKGHSSLPGFPWPASAPRYPSREQVTEYMQDYARFFCLNIRFDQPVTHAMRVGRSWLVHSNGKQYRSKQLIVATGFNRQPYRPTWADQDHYLGEVLHSAEYRNGQPFRGKRVLVVGFGNSGGEIAMDLHESGAQTSLAIRSANNVIPKEVFGIPFLSVGALQQWLPSKVADAVNAPLARWLMGDMESLGLKYPDEGPLTQMRDRKRIPFIDTGTIDLIRTGQITIRPGIERFVPEGVVFTDGQRESYDAVVLATGYRTGLQDWLKVGPGVLSATGEPVCSGLPIPKEPGLYFCGYHVAATGMLREIGIEAQRIASQIRQVAAMV